MRGIPATRSLLTASFLLGVSLWLPSAAGAGFPLSNDPSPLAVCQDTIRTASIRLASEARHTVSACLTAGVECVVGEPGDLDDCCRTAARRCGGRLERLERAETRFAVYVRNRRCSEVPFADLLALDGLGYESLTEACALLDPPAPLSDLGGLADCLARLLVRNTTCAIGTHELPRSPDALACLVHDDPRALAALDLAQCPVGGAGTPTPGTSTPTPASVTATPALTASATIAATVTAAPTVTATPIATQTATAVRTTTPTVVSTATSTAVATVQASPTPTRTATPSVSSTPLATATAVPTVAATGTSTATAVRTATAVLTATPVSTVTSTPVRTATAVPTATPIPAETTTPVRTATAVLTGTPIPTASTTPVRTATAVPTTTRTPTPVATSTPTGPVCGNGVQESGETCDDGNTSNCDTCPKNCVASTAPVACSATTVRHAQRIRLQAPTGALLSGGIACIDYPSGVVALPGSGNVAGRTSNLSGLVTLNDFNNAVQLTFVATAPGAAQVNPTISFDLCTGQTAPLPTAFSCEVKGASNQGNPIDPATVTCTPITIP